jgi:ABC-type spermidine/putrescine transport system permease subunit II
MIKKSPGGFPIIRSDFLSLLLLLFPIVATCIFIYLFYEGSIDGFTSIPIGIVVICLPLLILRVKYIRDLLNTARKLPG